MSIHPLSSPALSRRAVRLCVCAGVCVSAPAFAAPAIGGAAAIKQSVTGALSGREVLMSVGDEVKLRETVHTNVSGQARLILVDDTDVAILSRSTMTIDRYEPGSKVMSTPDGTFIIHTGHGSEGELHINTSAGTLTPQGTRFWFDARGGRMKLDVQEGAVRFCPRGKSEAYCVVATPGYEVTGSAGAPARIQDTTETPPGRHISPSPIIRSGGNTNTNIGRPPPSCTTYYHCGTGATGGGSPTETKGTQTYYNTYYNPRYIAPPYPRAGMFPRGGFRVHI